MTAASRSVQRIERPWVFARYVAIGDSSTEGLDDPDGRGGYHGWASRLAARVAAAQSSPLLYANLAIRGRSTRRIRDEQLEPAVAMRPDLVTLFTGTNDVVAPRFDADGVARDIEFMQRTLIDCGATVLVFTLPDLSIVLPLARLIAGRVRALNEALRHVSASSGAILVDFAKHSVGSDPRLWSDDRLHANSAGHERIAAALAWALRLPRHRSDVGGSAANRMVAILSREYRGGDSLAARPLPSLGLAPSEETIGWRRPRREAAYSVGGRSTRPRRVVSVSWRLV